MATPGPNRKSGRQDRGSTARPCLFLVLGGEPEAAGHPQHTASIPLHHLLQADSLQAETRLLTQV